MFLIISLILLKGYTASAFESYCDEGDNFDSSQHTIITFGKKTKRSTDPSRRWSMTPSLWSELLPENRAALVAEVVLALFLLLVLVDILGAVGSKESQSIYLYILRGNWTKGFNLFALTNIAIVDSIAVLSLIFTRIVLWILGNALSAKVKQYAD